MSVRVFRPKYIQEVTHEAFHNRGLRRPVGAGDGAAIAGIRPAAAGLQGAPVQGTALLAGPGVFLDRLLCRHRRRLCVGQFGLVQHHRHGLDKSGRGLIGGTLGYNLQTGNWVWCLLEGDISYSWMKGTAGQGELLGGDLRRQHRRRLHGQHGPRRFQLPVLSGSAAPAARRCQHQTTARAGVAAPALRFAVTAIDCRMA
jgi:hypothetical protein